MLEVRPGFAQAHFDLALCFEAQGRTADAETRSVRLEPTFFESRDSTRRRQTWGGPPADPVPAIVSVLRAAAATCSCMCRSIATPIEASVTTLGLEFIGFELHGHPDTFAESYKFWLTKPPVPGAGD